MVTRLLDFLSAKVLVALRVMTLQVAPESRSALATMVIPVGPVRRTWHVMSKLEDGLTSEVTAEVVLTDTAGSATVTVVAAGEGGG